MSDSVSSSSSSSAAAAASSSSSSTSTPSTEYQALLARSEAAAEQLSGVRAAGFVYVAAPLNDPPMLVLDLSKLPVQTVMNGPDSGGDDDDENEYAEDVAFSRLLEHFVSVAHRVVQRDYTLAVMVAGASSTRPSLAWLRRTYARLDRAYKKNLKQLYVVEAARWLRLLLALSRPFISPKFWRKLVYVRAGELNVRPRLSSVSRPLPPHRHAALLASVPPAAPLVRLPLVVTASLRGPPDDTAAEHAPVQRLGAGVAGRTVSTYPMSKGARMGQPIADHFRVDVAERGAAIVCVADGCGWGRRSSAASDLACSTFVQALKAELTTAADVAVALPVIADSLVESLLAADAAIGKGSTGPREECGTTTLCGAVVLPLAAVDDAAAAAAFAIALVSVGDCKAYLWRAATGVVEDITSGNRPHVGSAGDPGGRIGPAVDVRDADLRNIVVRVVVDGAPGDLLMIASDGVSDNIDPACMGVPVSAPDAASWDDVPALRQRFTHDLLARLVREQLQLRDAAAQCAGVADAVVEHCVHVLQPLADFMQAHADDRQPIDVPGKPDHTTICVLKLGHTDFVPVVAKASPADAAPAAASASAETAAAPLESISLS